MGNQNRNKRRKETNDFRCKKKSQHDPAFPPEDANLLSEFSNTHAGFLLSEESHPLSIRRLAYENFGNFLKFLRSHSALDLMTTSKSYVSAQLSFLGLFGFKGEWFDDLVRRLNDHIPGIADEDLAKWSGLEVAYSQHISALEEEYKLLSRKLDEVIGKRFAGKETLEHVSAKKLQIMEVRASLNVPFTI